MFVLVFDTVSRIAFCAAHFTGNRITTNKSRLEIHPPGAVIVAAARLVVAKAGRGLTACFSYLYHY
jgi:hypothetical protein